MTDASHPLQPSTPAPPPRLRVVPAAAPAAPTPETPPPPRRLRDPRYNTEAAAEASDATETDSRWKARRRLMVEQDSWAFIPGRFEEAYDTFIRERRAAEKRAYGLTRISIPLATAILHKLQVLSMTTTEPDAMGKSRFVSHPRRPTQPAVQYCYTTLDELATLLGMSHRSSIQPVIRALEEGGFLRVERRWGAFKRPLPSKLTLCLDTFPLPHSWARLFTIEIPANRRWGRGLDSLLAGPLPTAPAESPPPPAESDPPAPPHEFEDSNQWAATDSNTWPGSMCLNSQTPESIDSRINLQKNPLRLPRAPAHPREDPPDSLRAAQESRAAAAVPRANPQQGPAATRATPTPRRHNGATRIADATRSTHLPLPPLPAYTVPQASSRPPAGTPATPQPLASLPDPLLPAWEAVCARLRSQVSDAQFAAWITTLRLVALGPDGAVLACTSEHHRQEVIRLGLYVALVTAFGTPVALQARPLAE